MGRCYVTLMVMLSLHVYLVCVVKQTTCISTVADTRPFLALQTALSAYEQTDL